MMGGKLEFTFDHLQRHYATGLAAGYEFLTCRAYVDRKRAGALPPRIVVNRVDIDQSCKKARVIGQIFNALGIRGTFFVRLHAPEYNPFSFENYRALKFLRDAGHEIGYHSEVIDESAIWDEEAEACLRRDLDVLRRMLDVDVTGVASHGGMTGLNNLDFWTERRPSDFNLDYEAYDREPQFNAFHESTYVSDSSWTSWKVYKRGELVPGDRRSPSDIFASGDPLVYMLIHPETYYEEHFYE